ncbi:MAG: HAD-IA family hydrolase [Gemmatimonadota bacterium]|nr:HAD-IA family hydrolase [Gemmatimonadota bacterium]
MMSATDRWLLVDVGHVLIGFDHAVVGRRLVDEHFALERRTEATRAAVQAFIFHGTGGVVPNAELDRGAHDVDWLCARVCAEFNVAVAVPAFEEIWTSIFALQLNADVVACVDALTAAGVRVGLCSNTNASHWRFLRRTHAEFRHLDDAARRFVSFEMGAGKGEPGFFARVARETGAPLARHLLLDDKPENCAAARAEGMRAQVLDPTDAAPALRAVTETLLGELAHGT